MNRRHHNNSPSDQMYERPCREFRGCAIKTMHTALNGRAVTVDAHKMDLARNERFPIERLPFSLIRLVIDKLTEPSLNQLKKCGNSTTLTACLRDRCYHANERHVDMLLINWFGLIRIRYNPNPAPSETIEIYQLRRQKEELVVNKLMIDLTSHITSTVTDVLQNVKSVNHLSCTAHLAHDFDAYELQKILEKYKPKSLVLNTSASGLLRNMSAALNELAALKCTGCAMTDECFLLLKNCRCVILYDISSNISTVGLNQFIQSWMTEEKSIHYLRLSIFGLVTAVCDAVMASISIRPRIGHKFISVNLNVADHKRLWIKFREWTDSDTQRSVTSIIIKSFKRH